MAMGDSKSTSCAHPGGWSKEDFLPGESFHSWRSYASALSQTHNRLRDRFSARSTDLLELAGSGGEKSLMKKTLTWWDLTWFGVSAVMGAGVFVLTGEVARNVSGPAVVISYLLSGVAAFLCALCYTEFGVELPVAGGAFAYLRVELGDLVAYVAACNILFQYIVASASVARSWTSYFTVLCNRRGDAFRVSLSYLANGFNKLDPIAATVIAFTCLVTCLSVKTSSKINMAATVFRFVILIFIVAVGVTKADVNNLKPFAPFGVDGVVRASAMLFFAYIGFDAVFTLGEEVKNPKRDIPIGVISSMAITIGIYCVLALTLCVLQPASVMDINAPFATAFGAVGIGWAKYVVVIGALQSMTTILIASLNAQSRYFTHIGRTHMAPPFLSTVNTRTGTPINATITMSLVNAVVALFANIDVLAELLCIATLSVFSLIAIALMVRRYYVSGETTNFERNKLIVFVFLIVGSAVSTAIYHGIASSSDSIFWVGYAVSGTMWVVSTVGMKVLVKEARKPKVWGTLMPWVPSGCVLVNAVVMSSIEGKAYVKFAGWLVIVGLYYVFVALHTSYDQAEKELRGTNPSGGEDDVELGVVGK